MGRGVCWLERGLWEEGGTVEADLVEEAVSLASPQKLCGKDGEDCTLERPCGFRIGLEHGWGLHGSDLPTQGNLPVATSLFWYLLLYGILLARQAYPPCETWGCGNFISLRWFMQKLWPALPWLLGTIEYAWPENWAGPRRLAMQGPCYCPISIHSFLWCQEGLVELGVSEAGLGVGEHSRVRSAALCTATGVSFDAVETHAGDRATSYGETLWGPGFRWHSQDNKVSVCLCVCPQVQMRGGTGRKVQGLCSGCALLIPDPSPSAIV